MYLHCIATAVITIFFWGGLIDNDNYRFMIRAIVQLQTQFLPSSLRTENTKWTIASTSTQANGTTMCAHFLITRTHSLFKFNC